ncbi:acyl carrier protein [Candidatus Thioglobus sp.]|jgi:acyl carrier protein|nr:acyl carrier protein [Candidatus Thioglobus sp.]
MKNNQNILHHIQSIIAEALNVTIEKVSPEASQENFSEWDSMAYLTILSCVEDEFEISVSQENIDNFGSIPQIIDEIEKCQKK